MNENLRIANPTSSEIVALTSYGKGAKDLDNFGAPFYTYVDKKRRERFYKRKADAKVETFAMQWGKLCELYVHYVVMSEKGMFNYKYQDDVTSHDGGASTLEHPIIKGWMGTPDQINEEEKLVTDIKCPQSDNTHYDLIFPLYDIDQNKTNISGDEAIQMIRNASKEGEKYYWQLVSNACILGFDIAELVVFLPKFSTIQDIKNFNNGEDPRYPLAVPFERVRWKNEDEIFYLPDDSKIDELNFIRFSVPINDKDFLEYRVKKAIELINK